MDARRIWKLALGVATGIALGAAPAQGSTTVGETFADFNQGCSSLAATSAIYLQFISPSNKYAAPSPGVITSWSVQSGATVPPSLKFKVANPPADGQVTIVGESAPKAPVANALNTYDARISVAAGDVIGMSIPPGVDTFWCAKTPVTGYGMFGSLHADPAPGDSFFGFPFGENQIPVSAQLEADADSDGYGDETQDLCPADPAGQVPPCAELPKPPPDSQAPETAIDTTPKAVVKLKRKKRKAKVRIAFSSPTAGATFDCSLDGGPFAACVTPTTLKLRKGKHAFAVRATSAGLTDATPAKATFKVKRKRRR